MPEQDPHTYDEILPSLEYFSYRDADAGWSIEPALIDFHDVSYVMEGEAAYNLDQEPVTVRRGDLLYIPPNTRREASLTALGCFKVYATNFHVTRFSGQRIQRLPFERITPIGIQPDLITLYKALSTAWLMREKGYRLIVRAHLELILGKLFDLAVYRNPVSVADLRIRHVVEYITENHNRPITLRELAGLVHLSPTYLSVLFHQNMGITLNRYMNIIRVNHAESLLMSTLCNVTETAERCGFCDVYYFSRVFTEIKGYNPREIILKRGKGAEGVPGGPRG